MFGKVNVFTLLFKASRTRSVFLLKSSLVQIRIVLHMKVPTWGTVNKVEHIMNVILQGNTIKAIFKIWNSPAVPPRRIICSSYVCFFIPVSTFSSLSDRAKFIGLDGFEESLKYSYIGHVVHFRYYSNLLKDLFVIKWHEIWVLLDKRFHDDFFLFLFFSDIKVLNFAT